MLPKIFRTSTLMKNIFTILDNVIKCDVKKWREHVDKYVNRWYDQNNKIFVNKLKEIGIVSESLK